MAMVVGITALPAFSSLQPGVILGARRNLKTRFSRERSALAVSVEFAASKKRSAAAVVAASGNGIVNRVPGAVLASLALGFNQSALAADMVPSPQIPIEALHAAPRNAASPLSGAALSAPPVAVARKSDLPEDGTQWRYGEFLLNAVEAGKVERVRFAKDGSTLHLTAVDVTLPEVPDIVDIVAMDGVGISVSEGDAWNSDGNIIGTLLFPILTFGGSFFLFRRAQGVAGGPMDFGRSKSKFQEVPETGVTFADVAGAEQAKLELQDVVDFLKNPVEYTDLGGKIPKGCVLVGSPGTDKSLLARAVAGEAGVPFFCCAASEFVELLVGVGACGVRDLFEKAKAKAPCILFIDEIDAIGRQRGARMRAGNDEGEQTVNRFLTEMEGFGGNSGVIVLAATNRPDVLYSSPLRPGRFDRQETVDRPDVAGRVRILQVHSRGKSLAKDADFETIGRMTPGFTGADLQNSRNEAAILAARRDLIRKHEIADALERIVPGAEKKNAVVSEERRELVTHRHEAGHALVDESVATISIVPRGGGGAAGGRTFFAASAERLHSNSHLETQMSLDDFDPNVRGASAPEPRRSLLRMGLTLACPALAIPFSNSSAVAVQADSSSSAVDQAISSEFLHRLLLLSDLDKSTAMLAIALLGPFFAFFNLLFIFRIVMSWYPQLPATKFPFVIAYAPTEPVLGPTRRLIPPVGGVDVAPVIWVALMSFLNEILLGKQGLLILLSQQQQP